ncbi:MAG: hypothetical protein ACOYNI_02475 [Acidimicrobiia bacterium]
MTTWARRSSRALGAISLACSLVFAIAPARAAVARPAITKFGPSFVQPTMAIEAGFALYVAEPNSRQIKKVDFTRNNLVTVHAGTGDECTNTTQACGDGGPAKNAQLGAPNVLGAAPDGLLIADFASGKIRKVAFNTGIITTIVGTGVTGYSGDGGPATSAQIGFAVGAMIMRNGKLYFSDSANNRIRCVGCTGAGIISTVAGSGKAAGTDPGEVTEASIDGVLARQANLLGPVGLAFDPSGALVFADACDFPSAFGPILFGQAGEPVSYCDSTVRRVIPSGPSAGRIQTIAGTRGIVGSTGMDGMATKATLRTPGAITYLPGGRLLIGELGASLVAVVTASTQTQDYTSIRPAIRCVGCSAGGRISRVAGGVPPIGATGNNGPVRDARLGGATFGGFGGTHVYVADPVYNEVRRITGLAR